MLEQVKHKSSWNWLASGKHPTAGDYFRVGPEDALLTAFADWVESGYRQLVSGNRPVSGHHSWRFWSRGPKRNILICGVARDSSDSLGRPYPLMILGTGPLSGWGSNWDLLPYALDGIWSEVEYLARGRLTDLKQLKDGLSRIKLPSLDWLTLANQRAMVRTVNAGSHIAWGPDAMAKHVQSLLDIGDSFVLLNSASAADYYKLAGYWIWALKAHLKIIPSAVFMGGIPDKSYMMVFNRSLNPDDFVRLWTIADR